MTDVRDHLREWAMPHVLCPGCAHGIVLRSFLEAVDEQEIDRDRLAMVAGIGCSSRLVGYVDFCTLHGTHGRAPAFATGLKMARPELHVVVVTGDGDGLAIGANHLIHAARRNIDITVLLLNNSIYGMTGGQAAPTTPTGAVASTTPGGNTEPNFDACKLLIGAGASFVARVLAANPIEMTRVMVEGMTHSGFSFIEVVSDCPEYYGRYNGMGGGADMLTWMAGREVGVTGPLSSKRFVNHVPSSTPPPGIATGIIQREERPVFTGVHGESSHGP
ncbi:MAG: thiamine pyrophosphate-dependent enzyme [Acidimicrobiales bacterium]|jgi:2-oxoglutarate ferredoxin oxidoreductase subunit beta|nr:thiamine pyrophosphate-dependent enzyme [Acidimicrobiales bacterium]